MKTVEEMIKEARETSKSKVTRADKKALIAEIKGLVSHLDYVSASVVKEVTGRVVAAFARGRKMPEERCDEIIGGLIQYSVRSKTAEGKWFIEWARKIRRQGFEEASSKSEETETLVKTYFPRLAIELPDFGFATASDMGSEIHISSLAGFFHVFESEYDARVFALGIMDAIQEIENARSVIEPAGAIDENYEETAITDLENQIRVDAWLYGKNTEENL